MKYKKPSARIDTTGWLEGGSVHYLGAPYMVETKAGDKGWQLPFTLTMEGDEVIWELESNTVLTCSLPMPF